MGQATGNHICCSARDKNERGFNSGIGQFMFREEIEVSMQAKFMSFAPLWHKEAQVRRLALASAKEVHIYRVEGLPEERTRLSFEHSLTMDPGHEITGLLFCDENSSRSLAVAFSAEGRFLVRVWMLDSPSWAKSDYVASLEEHKAPVDIITISPTYLFTADRNGECGTWQKASFQKKAMARLHTRIADLAVDRLFVYSVGVDCQISVWSVPELTPVFTMGVDIPAGLGADGLGADGLTRLTHLRLPLSRWAGSQGRTGKAPKGSIFIAGMVGESGVLMHWMLDERVCKSAQVAHTSPIIALAYGPYDNGPLTTMDEHGTCRVWTWAAGLVCTQTVDIPLGCVAVAVEPQGGLYSLFSDRIIVWLREPCALGQ